MVGFNAPVRCEWPAEESRWVIVLNHLTFTDSKGIIWEAKPGSIVDGASIPRFCW